MKIMKKVIIVTLVVGGLIFARTGKNDLRSEGVKTQSKSNHYWVKGVSDKGDIKLDRKRSHKRRRKIRKPVKGLR
ncbi:MAG: hypothetical protein QF856_08495 [Candidatus Marinimicrobia bacterium]|nr:hypothetical protein [Candidatus Neomarinimicrobiota bacterium]MDP7464873.1 hypothetical protein [Candidatus Neomarinimicrobiota bacterium]